MKLSVIKLDGKASGDVELSDAVFGITDIRGEAAAGGGGPDVPAIQEPKPGLLERADRLVTNLNKVQ